MKNLKKDVAANAAVANKAIRDKVESSLDDILKITEDGTHIFINVVNPDGTAVFTTNTGKEDLVKILVGLLEALKTMNYDTKPTAEA